MISKEQSYQNSLARKNSNGKGDQPRHVDYDRYILHYGKINWQKKIKKEIEDDRN